ncbi:hypothetical protein LWE61_01035 [Sphingobium sufflavum]|jgi:hypothetical protein|uniref:hypothetical protein n=1 Tax=Sphingobium sufflavum TaxID=1129547 RepID=UPI001F34D20F|nr:hypothetical protein [Sphingobium sufflavum]MCE7795132.1 hypothetical protein [Sphingobium sufflavum]
MTCSPVKTLIATLALAVALPALATAAQAQGGPVDPATEKVKQVIVYGDDPCPTSDSGEILVCARMKEKDRYRIPTALRTDPNDPKVQSWLNRAEAIEYVGKSGTDSCSPVGGGGFTGCFQTLARNARAERRTLMGDANWSDLVAAERAKRLSVIDADSAKIEADAKAEEAAAGRKAAAPTTATPYP